MRKPLAKNTILKLQNTDRTYMIDSVLGVGANSFVYSAFWEDSFGLSHSVRIKELCPAKAEIDRNDDGSLTWKTDSERDAALQHFEGEYKKHQLLSSWQDAVNSTVQYQESLLCGNGTAYMIMGTDNGKPYCEVSDANLHELFKTLLALAKTVALYHEKGLLLLDIKPENFLVLSETRELVKLFDFDSVVSERKVTDLDTSISYSYDYAAPELRMGKRKSICKATDYYAVGSIAFSRIMNRFPEADDCLRFSDWDLSENSLFSSASPKSQRLIKAFFRKTLASHANARYSSDQELIDALQVITEETVPGRCFLYSARRAPLASFIGRDKELGKIHAAFTGGANIVFVCGLGGIGKTELAKAYGKRFENEYDTICFGTYKTDTDALLRDQSFISFANVPADNTTAESALRRLSLADSNTLLIVDDYSFSEDDPLFENLLALPCRILITTRERTRDLFTNEQTIRHITLMSLQADEQWDLFAAGYHGLLTDEEKQEIENLFATVEGHTMFIDLFAKNLQASGISVSEAVARFEKNGLSEISEAKIRAAKDGTKFDTIDGYFRILFDISNLSDDAKRALSCLAVLGDIHIDKRFLCKLSGSSLDALNLELISRGWVWYVEELDEVSSHAILTHSVYSSLDLSIESHSPLFQYLDNVYDKVIQTSIDAYIRDDLICGEWPIYETLGSVTIEQRNLVNELSLLISVYHSLSTSRDITNYAYAVNHHSWLCWHLLLKGMHLYFDFDFALDYDDIMHYYQNPLVTSLSVNDKIKLNGLLVFCASWVNNTVDFENEEMGSRCLKSAIDALKQTVRIVSENQLSDLYRREIVDFIIAPCIEAQYNGTWLYKDNLKTELNLFIDEVYPSFGYRFELDKEFFQSPVVLPEKMSDEQGEEFNDEEDDYDNFDLPFETIASREEAYAITHLRAKAEQISREKALPILDRIRILIQNVEFYPLNQKDNLSFYAGGPMDADRDTYSNTAIYYCDVLERLLDEYQQRGGYWDDCLELAKYDCFIQKTFAHVILGYDALFKGEMNSILIQTEACHRNELNNQSSSIDQTKIAKHFALLHGLYQIGKFKDCLDNSFMLIKSYEALNNLPALKELYGIYNIARKSAKKLHLIDLEIVYQKKIKTILNTDFYYSDYLPTDNFIVIK